MEKETKDVKIEPAWNVWYRLLRKESKGRMSLKRFKSFALGRHPPDPQVAYQRAFLDLRSLAFYRCLRRMCQHRADFSLAKQAAASLEALLTSLPITPLSFEFITSALRDRLLQKHYDFCFMWLDRAYDVFVQRSTLAEMEALLWSLSASSEMQAEVLFRVLLYHPEWTPRVSKVIGDDKDIDMNHIMAHLIPQRSHKNEHRRLYQLLLTHWSLPRDPDSTVYIDEEGADIIEALFPRRFIACRLNLGSYRLTIKQ